MPTDMKYWREVVQQQAKSIADENYQRQEWFENAKTTWYFPTEMFCKFFDDASAEDYFNSPDTGLTRQQINLGKHLVLCMRQLSNKYPRPDKETAKMIDDPLMIKCREAAKQLLAVL
jgi:hypothetical protein